MNKIVIVKELQSVRDVYQLYSREPGNTSKGSQVLTKRNGFCSGFFSRNSTAFPFSIHGETIENGCGSEATPRNGKTLS